MTLKPLLIKLPFGVEVNKVIHLAYCEGKKLFKTNKKVKVVDVINRPYGWIVVVENTSGEIEAEQKFK